VKRRAALAALAALAASGACTRDRGGPTGTARVVSIAPSTTESVFAIGAGALLVGRSRHCDHPAEATGLPVVGGFADPSVEAIVALAPTLVVGARGPAGPALEQALTARSIRTFFPETESLAQIESMFVELGRLLEREAEAEAVRGRVRAQIEGVRAAVALRKTVRAVMLFDVAPIVAAGPNGVPDELIRVAGGDNLITRGGAYPTIGLEHLLALDPDVIIDGAADAHEGGGLRGVAAQRDAAGWRELRAVREGRVRGLDTSAALRPGPRIGDGHTALARALHGDVASPRGAAP
jgi:iron complex transport system substrate-binding protein